MLWVLFLLLAAVGLTVGIALPLRAALGYLAVLIWVGFMLYLIFYRSDPVARALQEVDGKEVKP